MRDLDFALKSLQKMYQDKNLEMPVIEEFIIHQRWIMAKSDKRLGQILNMVGMRTREKKYRDFLKSMAGKRADIVAENIVDPYFREVKVAVLNLISATYTDYFPLEEEYDYRKGRSFDFDIKDMKVGLVGYGLYLENLYGKCKELRGFSLMNLHNFQYQIIKPDEEILVPRDVKFYTGKSAHEYREALEDLDLILISGSAIGNGSYLKIIEECKKAKIIGLWGPSAQIHPSILKTWGVNYIFSAKCLDVDTLLGHLMNPRNFNYFELKLMECYEIYM